MRRWITLAIFVVLLRPTGAFAQQSQPAIKFAASEPAEPFTEPTIPSYLDQRIGDPNICYLDPEFLEQQRLVVWQEQVGGVVWVCGFDPETGHFIPEDGKGQMVGNAAPITQTRNCPEFGVYSGGVNVYYVGTASNETLQLYRSRLTTGIPEQLTSGLTWRYGLYPSQEPTEPSVRLLYTFGRQPTTWAFYWLADAAPQTETYINRPGSNTPSGPRWVPGEVAIFSNTVVNGNVQLTRVDATTAGVTVLTNDAGDKRDGYFVQAPEFNNERLLVGTLDTNAVVVYRNINGAWTRINVVAAPYGTTVKHFSAEPFVYKSRTYVTVGVETGVNDNYDIWVLGLDPARPLALRINDDTSLHRADPESLVVGDKAFGYWYTWPDSLGRDELHCVRLFLPD